MKKNLKKIMDGIHEEESPFLIMDKIIYGIYLTP